MASILLWLWKHHEECFQKAFAKSGRIDVDPECKWLVHAAVDSTFRALTRDSAKAAAKGSNTLSAALTTHRSRMQKGTEAEKAAALKKLEIATMCAVSKALMSGLKIDEEMVSTKLFSCGRSSSSNVLLTFCTTRTLQFLKWTTWFSTWIHAGSVLCTANRRSELF